MKTENQSFYKIFCGYAPLPMKINIPVLVYNIRALEHFAPRGILGLGVLNKEN